MSNVLELQSPNEIPWPTNDAFHQIAVISHLLTFRCVALGLDGIEPSYTVYETGALPLSYRPGRLRAATVGTHAVILIPRWIGAVLIDVR